MSDCVWPHRRQPTKLPCPWDPPGKNTGVGCHFLLQCMKVKSESEVTRLCPTLSDPMDCSLPGSSVHGIFQARVLEWGAIAFSDKQLYHSQNNNCTWCWFIFFHTLLSCGYKCIFTPLGWTYWSFDILIFSLIMILWVFSNSSHILKVIIWRAHYLPTHTKSLLNSYHV